ncbi:MAG: hypothetical protein FWE84_01540 [Firmicutes bacterium]|nr:hypothetical protein [Bacillota bacterium]
MPYLDIILSIITGGLVAALLAIIFSLKTKGILRLLINAAAGVTALIILSLFKVPGFNLNPLSAFISASTGVPGLLVTFIIVTFL